MWPISLWLDRLRPGFTRGEKGDAVVAWLATGTGVWAARLVKLAVIPAGCYAGLLALAYTFQRRILYFPNKRRVLTCAELKAYYPQYADIEEFRVQSDPGITVLGWYWPPPLTSKTQAVPAPLQKRSRTHVLYLHGNAGSRQDRLGMMRFLRKQLMVGLAMVDYRGFGGSDGSPTEAGLLRDGAAALHWLAARIPAGDKIVLHCESIGSGVGLPLVTQGVAGDCPKVNGVIVEGGFSSIVDVAKDAMPLLLPQLLLKDRFDNIPHAQALRAKDRIPFMFLHGLADTLVPIRHARKLYAALPKGNKAFIQIAGANHNELPLFEGYAEQIALWMDKYVWAPPPRAASAVPPASFLAKSGSFSRAGSRAGSLQSSRQGSPTRARNPYRY